MENTMNTNSKKMIGAVVVGALVGVGIGMLFAPDKGSVTRTKLMKSGKKMKRKMNGTLKKPTEVSSKNTKRPPLI